MTDIDHEFKIFRGQTAMNKWSKVVFVVVFFFCTLAATKNIVCAS